MKILSSLLSWFNKGNSKEAGYLNINIFSSFTLENKKWFKNEANILGVLVPWLTTRGDFQTQRILSSDTFMDLNMIPNQQFCCHFQTQWISMWLDIESKELEKPMMPGFYTKRFDLIGMRYGLGIR